MNQTLSQCAKFGLHSTAVAAGAAAIDSLTGIDTAGYDGICFQVTFGAIVSGAATSFKVQVSSDSGSTDDWTDVAGTSVTVADDADNTVFYLDYANPEKRYVRLYISRATQNSTVNAVTYILYWAKALPVTQAATGELHVGAVEGTA